MRDLGQALLGISAAVVSTLIVFGSLALSMAEGNVSIAFLPSDTPTSTQPIPTQRPGEPTYTPSPTPLATATSTMITPSGLCQTPPGWTQVAVEIGEDWASSRSKIRVYTGRFNRSKLHRWVNGWSGDLDTSSTPYSNTN